MIPLSPRSLALVLLIAATLLGTARSAAAGAPTGACCFGNGFCSETTELDCLNNMGDYFGDGTVCFPNLCTQPTGACCLEESCLVVTFVFCKQQGGQYLGPAMPCQPDNPCLLPLGACCLDEICVPLNLPDCQSFNGFWQGAETACTPNPCLPTGACCAPDGSCTVEAEADCDAAGGAYQGDGSDCASANCQPPTCPADITGPQAGVPDGNVDALDYLRMISQWGSPCGDPCDADITGPTKGVPDGNVDSLDFLQLIAQWGSPANCP
jgi:hypothetical protein